MGPKSLLICALGLGGCADAAMPADLLAPPRVGEDTDATVVPGPIRRGDAGALRDATDTGNDAALDALPPDAAPPDAAPPDAAPPGLDAAPAPDAGPSGPDAAPAEPDATPPAPDAAAPDPLPEGATPCANGPGWTVWRFHYDGHGDSARVDVWDAACDYLDAADSDCRVATRCGGADCEVGWANDHRAVALDGAAESLHVRFSVAGLEFEEATVYLLGRSLSVAERTWFEAWSPLYGGREGGPVDPDLVYDWHALDWTTFLDPADDPARTEVRITPTRGAGSLGVAAMELCVR